MEEKLNLTIAHLYPKLLNIYGDFGNVLALKRRCEYRNIDCEIVSVNVGNEIDIEKNDIYFIGGGQDKQQIEVSEELQKRKEALTQAANDGRVFLAICGGYQLLGKYYQPHDGEKLLGIGVLDAYTVAGDTRFIGNVTAETDFLEPKTLVGFENHAGLTYLEDGTVPLAKVVVGNGNNSQDGGEGGRKNNVFGTLNVLRACDKHGVSRFVLISTDKAVNPTSVMGTTKRICEMLVQTFNEKSKTEFVAVRFGNVLGSNGSVIPLFINQIKEGGPVTVTHEDIIRYFMTIPEACQLVLQAGAIAKGGEIFILDMGEPVKILDLAKNLIRLSGYEPYKDIDIKITGLRPGEKLYEEILLNMENSVATDYEKIFIEKPIVHDVEALKDGLERLDKVKNTLDKKEITDILKDMVPTFKPDLLNK